MVTLIVLCGPPCSGKSTISTALQKQSEFSSWPRIEMDKLRLALTPFSHTAEDRAKAYARMHELAADAVRTGAPGVILDATYQPAQQRHALRVLAEAMSANLIIFECFVTPEEAVERFKWRDTAHAAIDLTAERVWDLAHDFPYYYEPSERLHSSQGDERLLEIVVRRAKGGAPTMDLDEWVSKPAPIPGKRQPPTAEAAMKMTSKSRAVATGRSLFRGAAMLVSVVAALAAFSVAVKPSLVAPGDAAGWAQFWAAFALLIAGLAAAYEFFFTGPGAKLDKLVLDAGRFPRFELSENLPLNRDLFHRYWRRIVEAQRDRMLIADTPLWFIVPPRSHGFDVVTKQKGLSRVELDLTLLEKRSAKIGLDWSGFLIWRAKQKEDEYYNRLHNSVYKEVGVRVLDLSLTDEAVTLHVCKGSYKNQVCTELSANLNVEGRFGFEMRQVLEGPAWSQSEPSNRTDRIDLANVPLASKTHEMLVSVQVALTTRDGYLALQRRSNRVQSAAGGVASSGAGGAIWKDLLVRRSLKESALRETLEEIGWEPDWHDDLSTPFLGAAFNLLRGRDLNFYCHFHTERTFPQVSSRASLASHAWEVAHLIPVPIEAIQNDGTVLQPFSALIGDARHVRGLLYCLAQSEKFRSIREPFLSRIVR